MKTSPRIIGALIAAVCAMTLTACAAQTTSSPSVESDTSRTASNRDGCPEQAMSVTRYLTITNNLNVPIQLKTDASSLDCSMWSGMNTSGYYDGKVIESGEKVRLRLEMYLHDSGPYRWAESFNLLDGATIAHLQFEHSQVESPSNRDALFFKVFADGKYKQVATIPLAQDGGVVTFAGVTGSEVNADLTFSCKTQVAGCK